MTLDNFVESDILATCNALGSEIKGVYVKGFECVECLKDILRYLRRDSDEHSILRYLGSLRLLQTDLLPLIKMYYKDQDIFDFTLRILIALTSPAILYFKENIPEDKISRNVYLQIISYLQAYKKAFVDIGVWHVFYEQLKDLLEVRPIERSSEENLTIERIIIIIRNVLHVPPDESIFKQIDDDLSLHDKVIWSLHQSKISILLLYISANEDEHQYCLHVLEIVSLILREHTAEALANCNEIRSDTEKQNDINILLAARQREHNLQLQKVQTVCKSRFNSVYCVKNMKSLSDKDYIAHKLITDIDDIKFDLKKSARRRPKNRVRAPEMDNTRQSTLNIRLYLKTFCIEFLKTYNKLMVSVKRELLRKVSEDQDETYYFWAVFFFMQFNRLYDFQTALVSETISTQTFHHINTQITNYYEMMLSDKKKMMFWAKRMQLGVSAYKEVLETLRKMERSDDEIIRNSADTLISHVFYVIEYREMLLSLISNYDEIKFPLSYLAELIESTQLFLKMLENHSKKHSEIIVQKKQRKVRRRKNRKQAAINELINEDEQLNKQWDAVTSELSAAVQGMRPIPDVTAFDGASGLTFEKQKIEVVFKIREALIANEPCKALGLLRAARELWPEGDTFGSMDIEPEPEFLILREIHFSNLKKYPVEKFSPENKDETDEEDEEEESISVVAEQQLDLSDVYKKYASPKVVQPCSLLLSSYQNNKPQTNMCLLKLLHRIAWNCKMHALFFQSTIFLTFQKIFHDPDVNHDPVLKELYRFAKFIIHKFFVVAEKNKKSFVELLFWKGQREAYELEESYETSANRGKGWTEDDDDELRYLFEENKDICIEGQDVADIIFANFNNKKTKPEIISALKRLDLIKSKRDLKPEKRSEWLESEIVELQHLYEDFKGSNNVMGTILEKLSIKRSRKAVVDKLLELNLIHDRKEVRKKASRKNNIEHEDSDSSSSDESHELAESDVHGINKVNDKNNFINSDSSDEDERIFFKNLEAERLAEDNNSLHNDINFNEDVHSYMEKHIEQKKEENEYNTHKIVQPSHIWEEQEILELTALFHENYESNDIMPVLLNALTVKRPKQAVIIKLLELGLIKDKKEICKIKDSKYKKKMLDETRDSRINDDSNLSDIENSLNAKYKFSKEKKFKRRVLSDSSDEDVPNNFSSLLNNSKGGGGNYGVEKLKKKKEPVVWEEQEIFKLNELFSENKDSNDLMNIISKGLPVKKTKKDITEKLIEIGFIKSKKEIKKISNGEVSSKPKKKKASDLWEEQECIELNQLYEEGKNSNDVMNYILNGLTFKRPKQSVIKKLLEIGLINDKKEIRKRMVIKQNDNIIKESKGEDIQTKNALRNKTLPYDNEASAKNIKNNTKSDKKKKSESSDDENLPLSYVNLSLNTTDYSKQQNINKKYMSDSSDNEIFPLSHVISQKSKQSIKFSELNSQESETNRNNEVYNPVNSSTDLYETVESPSFLIPTDNSLVNSTLQVRKRKRLLISDDSSDDDVTHTEQDTNYDLVNEAEKISSDHVPSKSRKKRLRVLDDSDDSD